MRCSSRIQYRPPVWIRVAHTGAWITEEFQDVSKQLRDCIGKRPGYIRARRENSIRILEAGHGTHTSRFGVRVDVPDELSAAAHDWVQSRGDTSPILHP